MNQLGAKSANDLKIEVELQTILDPCNICQGQMTVLKLSIIQRLIFIVVALKMEKNCMNFIQISK